MPGGHPKSSGAEALSSPVRSLRLLLSRQVQAATSSAAAPAAAIEWRLKGECRSYILLAAPLPPEQPLTRHRPSGSANVAGRSWSGWPRAAILFAYLAVLARRPPLACSADVVSQSVSLIARLSADAGISPPPPPLASSFSFSSIGESPAPANGHSPADQLARAAAANL